MTTISDEQKQEILNDRPLMLEIISTYLAMPRQPRTAYLRFAATEAEVAQVELAAKELHMNASEYMRFKVLAEINNTATKPA